MKQLENLKKAEGQLRKTCSMDVMQVLFTAAMGKLRGPGQRGLKGALLFNFLFYKLCSFGDSFYA